MFKKIASLLLMGTFYTQAQEQVQIQTARVEKSVFSVQTGLIGVWANNEARLSNHFALRSEIGLELYTLTFKYSDNTETVFAPVISVEPKYYYNLEKRVRKGRSINNNSGNSISLKLHYNPDWFLLAKDSDIKMASQIAILPKWGIRRVYGKHFTFEAGVGIGPVFYLGKYAENYDGDVNIYGDAIVRIGYTF